MQTAILFALVIIGALVFLRLLFPASSVSVGRQTSTRISSKIERRSGREAANPFHAVSIHPTVQGCAAAAAIKGKRFLSAEAPGLPLGECTAAICHCTYAHHVDRRRGNGDRRLVFAMRHNPLVVAEPGERRVTTGRRDGDLEAA